MKKAKRNTSSSQSLFALLMALGLAICLTSCLRLDSNLYNPDTDIDAYLLDDYQGSNIMEVPDSLSIPDSLVDIFTLTSDNNGDQATIWAIYVGDKARIATDTVIMYCHGNARHMDAYWSRVKLLANAGGRNRFGVLIIDYRGYGLSEGTPTESNLYADVDAALQWLKDNGLNGDRLAIYGNSMGSAPATELTASHRSLDPAWLMLEAPFASSDVMVQDAALLALPGSYFTNLKIDNAEEIKKVEQPFLWMHGMDDDFLALPTHGEVVFKNYAGVRGVPVRIPGADHGDVPPVMGFQAYMDTVANFLTHP